MTRHEQGASPRPSQGQLIFPLIETLEAFGGVAGPREVAATLADSFRLSEEEVSKTVRTNDGQLVNLWQRHVRFARQKAKELGYIEAHDETRQRGLWELSQNGREALRQSSPALIVEILTDPTNPEFAVGARINLAVGLPTTHLLTQSDARSLSWVSDGEIPLVVTSCPYFDLKEYDRVPGQLAMVETYEAFLEALDEVWRGCYRMLSPGGRLAINVGDVLRARGQHGSHHVLPLHADILARSTRMGFHALNGILWHKFSNCAYEGGNGGMLGRPGAPNGVIKLEVEHILLLKKPGPYRNPSRAQLLDGAISKSEYGRWFRSIWTDIQGERSNTSHPAPFPVEIPYRLVRMFSYPGDTICDPMCGSATTAVGAARAGRNSLCSDISATYIQTGIERLKCARLV